MMNGLSTELLQATMMKPTRSDPIYLMMIPLPKLALDKEERYVITVIPQIALYYINWLHAYYSLHIEANEPETGIVIRIKNKDKKTLHISKKAKEVLEPYLYQQ